MDALTSFVGNCIIVLEIAGKLRVIKNIFIVMNPTRVIYLTLPPMENEVEQEGHYYSLKKKVLT